MAERGTRLIVDIADEPVPVVGDPARLQQIQANLLSNAVEVLAARGAASASKSAATATRRCIRVSDNGQGIEPRCCRASSTCSSRASSRIARSEGGLGIGLTLLRSLVELHDGRVEAHSDGAGKGSVFTVWLPLDGRCGAADATAAPRRPTGAHGRPGRGSGRRAADDAAVARVGGRDGVRQPKTASKARR